MSNSSRRLLVDMEIPDPVGEWRATRISWTAMALLTILASLGLFGDGPIAQRTVVLPDGVRVRMDRVMRLGVESQLEILAAGQIAAAPIRTVLAPQRMGWQHIGVRGSRNVVHDIGVLVLP